ncbi:MAG: MFS transporter [Kofleriaceae bacterium]|jgi:MFS family permease|nr:MFS transporter [Kofleriaceae bacterium]MBP6836761.1 MFS transporter [Kofleriaceae bacterium]MBP9207002.1 MFS transporter [Kofleriaceae bacterium]
MRELRDLLRRNRDFAALFWAMVISLAGDWFAFVAVSGLVTEVTGRPSLAAFIYAANALPVFFLAPIAGVLADRLDRRRVLIAADLARVPVALGLCAAAAWGSATLAIACSIGLALLSTFFDPVAAAALPNLVDERDLPLAQAASNGVWGAMLLVGAGLGGLIAATLGRQAAFVINAGSFVLSALLVARITRPLQEARRSLGPAERAGLRASLTELLVFVRERPLVGALMSSKPGVGVANGIVGLLPGVALGRFGAGDAGTGLLLGARGLGALLGPLAAARVRPWLRPGRSILLVCGGSMLLYSLTYALLPLAPTLASAAVLVLVAHLGGGAQWSLSTYGLQLVSPDEIRGRILSVDYGLATLAIGLSAIGAGVGTEWIGPDRTIWVMTTLGVLYALTWSWWTRRSRVDEPPPELLKRSASGPATPG